MPTVLITDDDPDHRELLTIALRRFGHNVVEAEDAASASRALASSHIDAVLLDNRMPGESGIEFCRRLRADPATADLEVLMMTASPGVLEESRSTVEALGGTMLYAKPYSAEELAEVIGRTLAQGARG